MEIHYELQVGGCTRGYVTTSAQSAFFGNCRNLTWNLSGIFSTALSATISYVGLAY